MLERHGGHVDAVARQHVDHARWETGLLEQFHGQVRRELLGGRRLPDHGVAHEGRRRRKVAGDRGEVERRDRVDEAFEGPVVAAVPEPAAVRDRLLGEDAPREVDVEPPEVDELARRVDLRLERGFRLAQHGRRVQPLAPRSESSSAALSSTAARSSKLAAAQPGAASFAASTAALASSWVAARKRPTTWAWSWGSTTACSAPPHTTFSPPMVAASSSSTPCWRASSSSRAARPAVSGA